MMRRIVAVVLILALCLLTPARSSADGAASTKAYVGIGILALGSILYALAHRPSNAQTVDACAFIDSFSSADFGYLNAGSQLPVGRILAFDPTTHKVGPEAQLTIKPTDYAPQSPPSTTTESATVKLSLDAQAKLPASVNSSELQAAISNAFSMTVTNYVVSSLANPNPLLNADSQAAAIKSAIKKNPSMVYALVISNAAGDHLAITRSDGTQLSGNATTVSGASGSFNITYNCSSGIDQTAKQGNLFYKIIALKYDPATDTLATDVGSTPDVRDYKLIYLTRQLLPGTTVGRMSRPLLRPIRRSTIAAPQFGPRVSKALERSSGSPVAERLS